MKKDVPLAIPIGPLDEAGALAIAAAALDGAALAHGDGRSLLWRGVELKAAFGGVSGAAQGATALFCPMPMAPVASLRLGFGPHAEGGERVRPMLAALLEAGARLAERFRAEWVHWAPASLFCEAGYFAASARDCAAGGPAPVLSLIALADDGAAIRTRGLAYFCDQEAQMVAPGLSAAERARRIVRIVNDMMANGGYAEPLLINGLAPGERIAIVPGEPGGWTVATLMDAP